MTGDKELLSLKQHKSTRIITPAAMIALAHVREVRDCSRNVEAIRRARWPRIEL